MRALAASRRAQPVRLRRGEARTVVGKKAIAAAVDALRRAANPRRVLLFGSYAPGSPDEESDADFLVLEEDVPDVAAEMVRLRRALSPMRIPVDVLVVSESQFADWSEMRDSRCRSSFRASTCSIHLHPCFGTREYLQPSALIGGPCGTSLVSSTRGWRCRQPRRGEVTGHRAQVLAATRRGSASQ